MATMPRPSIWRPASAPRLPTRTTLIGRRGFGRRRTARRRHRAGRRRRPQADIRRARDRRGAEHVRRGPVAHRDRRPQAAAGPCRGRRQASASRSSSCSRTAARSRWKARWPTRRRSSRPGSSERRPGTRSPTCCSAPTAPRAACPSSFPRRSGQQPYYYAHKHDRPSQSRTGKLEHYKARFRGITNTALYPFGHGLTYGKIDYSDFTISAPTMAMNGEIAVDGADHQPRPADGRRGRPALHARSRRKHHAPGPRDEGLPQDQACAGPVGSRPLHAAARQSAVLRRDQSSRSVEPGTFDVWIAPSAEADGVRGTFELTA